MTHVERQQRNVEVEAKADELSELSLAQAREEVERMERFLTQNYGLVEFHQCFPEGKTKVNELSDVEILYVLDALDARPNPPQQYKAVE
jgi:hypothetical protein